MYCYNEATCILLTDMKKLAKRPDLIILGDSKFLSFFMLQSHDKKFNGCLKGYGMTGGLRDSWEFKCAFSIFRGHFKHPGIKSHNSF